jgi:hypothetical protein
MFSCDKNCFLVVLAWIERGETQYHFRLPKQLIVPNWNHVPTEYVKFITHCANPLRTPSLSW